MKLIAIIIDDEENSSLLLKEKLAKWHPEIAVVDVCDNAKAAMLAIARHMPNLVFLDIQMPEVNGLEFFRYLNNLKISVQCIITTAYSQPEYFKEAIRLGLTDYLIKPVLQDEMNAAVANAVKRISSGRHKSSLDDILNAAQRIPLPTPTGAIYISVAQILYIKAAGKYSELYTVTEKETIMLGISELEEQLKGSPVMRIDRFTMINKNYIQKVSLQFHRITLQSGRDKVEIEVSKRGAEQAIEYINSD